MKPFWFLNFSNTVFLPLELSIQSRVIYHSIYLAMIESENSNFIFNMWKYNFSSLHLEVSVEYE